MTGWRFLVVFLFGVTAVFGCGAEPDGRASASTGGQSDMTGMAGSVSSAGTPSTTMGGSAGTGGRCPALEPARLTMGPLHACVLLNDNQPACWGDSDFLPPSVVTAPHRPFSDISAGDDYTCGLTQAGAVECWGVDHDPPPPGPFVRIAASQAYTCGLAPSGAVTCWGGPVPLLGTVPSAGVRNIVAGVGFFCALHDDDSVTCQITGNDNHGITATPPGPFVSITAGRHHACGIRPSGIAECWGAGGPGDANTGDPPWVHFGQSVAPAGQFKRLGAGYAHTCGIRMDDTLTCWGAGTTRGTCGDLYDCGQADPPDGTFSEVDGGFTHSCATTLEGGVRCWGSNTGGRATPPADP
jgi:hypothetical protein